MMYRLLHHMVPPTEPQHDVAPLALYGAPNRAPKCMKRRNSKRGKFSQ